MKLFTIVFSVIILLVRFHVVLFLCGSSGLRCRSGTRIQAVVEDRASVLLTQLIPGQTSIRRTRE